MTYVVGMTVSSMRRLKLIELCIMLWTTAGRNDRKLDEEIETIINVSKALLMLRSE